MLQESSSFCASMLDCKVFKGQSFVSTGRVDYSPYIKPTARHVPLDQSSAHAPSIHRSWPVNEIARMYSRSLRHCVFEYFRRVKIRRFEQFFMSPAILQQCKSWRRPVRSSKSTKQFVAPVLGFVVPWHPMLRGLGSRLQQLSDEWRATFSELVTKGRLHHLKVQVAFSNAASPLHIRCRT